MEEKLYTQSELTEAVRAAIQDRATWFYLLLKAGEKQGVDTERMAYDAITEFGKMKGKKMADAKNAGELVNKISEGPGFHAFAMERVKSEETVGDRKSVV